MIYQVDTKITGVFTPRPQLWLAGHEIDISYNGASGYKGRDVIAIDELLVVQFRGPGLSGQQWELALTLTPRAVDGSFPLAQAKVWKHPGEIPAGQSSTLYKEVEVPLP